MPTAADIVSHHRGGDASQRLDPEDVIITMNRINYSMNDKNPLDSVKWVHSVGENAPLLQGMDCSIVSTLH